ncbi:MAG: hypothetical protein GY705_02795 [Bacteroidetes bacterium]|nr:hypothetical protein [Bacteroidota bacterium]
MTNLFQNVLSIFINLLDVESASNLKNKKNRTFEIINFFENPDNIEKVLKNRLSNHEMFIFINGILEAFCLSLASGGKGWDIVDKSLIGNTTKDIQGKLLARERDNNIFSFMFQAWYNLRDSEQKISDIEMLEELQEQNKCDFKIQLSNKQYELVECKKLSPSKKNHQYSQDKLLRKIEKHIGKGKQQLSETESFFVENQKTPKANFKQILIDISNYGENSFYRSSEFDIYGINESSEIKQILSRLGGKNISGIDKITLYWNNIIKKENQIFCSINKCASLSLSENKSAFPNDGFTIEFLPNPKNHNAYSDLRISSTSRSLSWVKASWLSSTDQLITFSNAKTG